MTKSTMFETTPYLNSSDIQTPSGPNSLVIVTSPAMDPVIVDVA